MIVSWLPAKVFGSKQENDDNRERLRKMNNAKPDKVLKIESLPVDQLLLDPENPRLESVAKTKDQLELIKAMWREMAVSEVALSIAENGFFEEEPLFAVPASKEKGEMRYLLCLQAHAPAAASQVFCRNAR